MRRVLAQGLVALLLAASLGAAPAANGPNSKESSAKAYQVGKASWYGKYFHGKTTASGEPYNMFEFTAAHRNLPLGTWVKVTNLRNGKWVVLRVNDRGPYAGPSRIIDVSYGAAQLLGFRERGLTKVRLDIVEPEQLALADDMVGLD